MKAKLRASKLTTVFMSVWWTYYAPRGELVGRPPRHLVRSRDVGAVVDKWVVADWLAR
jgi:hypothetical protein